VGESASLDSVLIAPRSVMRTVMVASVEEEAVGIGSIFHWPVVFVLYLGCPVCYGLLAVFRVRCYVRY